LHLLGEYIPPLPSPRSYRVNKYGLTQTDGIPPKMKCQNLLLLCFFLFHQLSSGLALSTRHDAELDTNNLEKRFSDTYTLFVTHFDGTVYTLNFNFVLNGTSTIDIVQELNTCGAKPSWLGVWGWNGVASVYCLDGTYEDADGNPANGSVTVYTLNYLDGLNGEEGSLTEAFSFEVPPGPVAAEIYQPDYGYSDRSANESLVLAH
jgi:hypothetical protein